MKIIINYEFTKQEISGAREASVIVDIEPRDQEDGAIIATLEAVFIATLKKFLKSHEKSCDNGPTCKELMHFQKIAAFFEL